MCTHDREDTAQVRFQMQVSEGDEERVSQQIVKAAESGQLTAKLQAGGLDVSVPAMSPPEVKSQGSQTQQLLSTAKLNIIVGIVVGVLALCAMSVVCIKYRKAACLHSKHKVKDIKPLGVLRQDAALIVSDQVHAQPRSPVITSGQAWPITDVPQRTDSRNPRLSPKLTSSQMSSASSFTEIITPDTTESASSCDPPEARLAQTVRVISPLWARIVDDLSSLDEHERRVMNVDRVLDVVQGAYDSSMTEANSAQDGTEPFKIDLRSLLPSHKAMKNSAASTDINYVSFCELMAPDVLSRCALQLFFSLKRTGIKGACRGELQHALMRGRIKSEDIAIITGSQNHKEWSAPRGSSREFISFFDFHKGLCSLLADFTELELARNDVASSLLCETGPGCNTLNTTGTNLLQMTREIGPAKPETRRAKLERDLRACCDAVVVGGASCADEANLHLPQRAPPRPSTGRIGSRKLLEKIVTLSSLEPSILDGCIRPPSTCSPCAPPDEDMDEAGNSPAPEIDAECKRNQKEDTVWMNPSPMRAHTETKKKKTVTLSNLEPCILLQPDNISEK